MTRLAMLMLLPSLALTCAAEGQAAQDLRDVVGVTHVAGLYHLTDGDFLNEGAHQILALGSRVIKVWFWAGVSGRVAQSYPYNSHWPKVESLVEGARTPYFRDLFRKPFTTYILVVASLGRDEGYWRKGITEEQREDEQRQFYELAKYLLTEYRGTGKTFILQHWEGDWLVRGNFKGDEAPAPAALANMVEWLNARQAGVDQARREVGKRGHSDFSGGAEVGCVPRTASSGQEMVRGTHPTAIGGAARFVQHPAAGGRDAPHTTQPIRASQPQPLDVPSDAAGPGVRVYHAAEVNRVVQSVRTGVPNVVNKVLPHTRVDLVSYSAWDAATAHYSDPNVLREALDFIAAHAPDSLDFGARNVYLGEFGMPENVYSPEKVRIAIPNAVRTALDWGCPYIVYWELYCNELKDPSAKPPVRSNDAVRGFWLIRPDGTRAWTWDYFHGLLAAPNPDWTRTR